MKKLEMFSFQKQRSKEKCGGLVQVLGKMLPRRKSRALLCCLESKTQISFQLQEPQSILKEATFTRPFKITFNGQNWGLSQKDGIEAGNPVH